MHYGRNQVFTPSRLLLAREEFVFITLRSRALDHYQPRTVKLRYRQQPSKPRIYPLKVLKFNGTRTGFRPNVAHYLIQDVAAYHSVISLITTLFKELLSPAARDCQKLADLIRTPAGTFSGSD